MFMTSIISKVNLQRVHAFFKMDYFLSKGILFIFVYHIHSFMNLFGLNFF